jgi:hypothetical protein
VSAGAQLCDARGLGAQAEQRLVELAQELRAVPVQEDGDALDRWELALFQDDPFRAEQLRHALEAALGDGDGTWAAGMRAAALLGETAQARADLVDRFRKPTLDLVRRLLVAVLLHGNRAKLLRELDQSLLGLRASPAGVAELRAS